MPNNVNIKKYQDHCTPKELHFFSPTIASALGGALANLNLGLVNDGFRFQMGFLPGILGPCMIPSACPKSSNARSRRIASARSDRTFRVSVPWVVLASAQRCQHSGVLGPVDAPPWNLHFVLPFDAVARHCCFVRCGLVHSLPISNRA